MIMIIRIKNLIDTTTRIIIIWITIIIMIIIIMVIMIRMILGVGIDWIWFIFGSYSWKTCVQIINEYLIIDIFRNHRKCRRWPWTVHSMPTRLVWVLCTWFHLEIISLENDFIRKFVSDDLSLIFDFFENPF